MCIRDSLQGIQWYIADMATKTEAAKALVYYAAYLEDSGKPFTTEAAKMCIRDRIRNWTKPHIDLTWAVLHRTFALPQ